ncbi:Helicase PriA essential for oriC/DnaA-independent DNA replication [Methylophaga frappieri]|uniref:Replication restart protein PriA n=1 Tax=Methylophaga frappieri (strain ATCC BAA-2434 / DSM 25690 / JAM7) TaxID=754477 RepID=I1YJL5_METFJ|nr:Helicase PriA essential for oriC/DnaA-independent DNA replication [Methylophaga frappieri]
MPFGKKQRIGIVVHVKSDQEKTRPLKKILDRCDKQPIFDSQLFQLILWISQYYHHPIGECFFAALPKKVRLGDTILATQETIWKLTKSIDEISDIKGIKQKQALTLLQRNPGGLSERELRHQLGSIQPSLKRMAEKKWITSTTSALMPFSSAPSTELNTLNQQQQAVYSAITEKEPSFQPWLIDGITGSGKTEIYLHLAASQLAKGHQVLILIPEIGLSSQLVDRFTTCLAGHIVVSHSGMTDRQRHQSWCLAKSGQADVIIGTRSAAFMPLHKPGLIIIDEEHDGAYKQQDGLRYHARNILLVRARDLDIPIVMGSATPSLESLYQVKQNKYRHLKLNKRAGQAILPEVILADSNMPTASPLTPTLVNALKETLSQKQQALIFINRRGYAPVLMCHNCQWQAYCPDCDAKMVVHQQRQQLYCHHCGRIQRLPKTCPACESDELKTYGTGTEKIESTIQELFPQTTVIRVDRDTTRGSQAFQQKLEPIRTGQSAVLVGTQMLAKGHDFHQITLVGIVDADQGLFSADFRAMEYLCQSVVQVMGRAGRGQKAGKVIIQTSQPGHPVWSDLLRLPYAELAQSLLQERIEMALPPSCFWSIFRAESVQSELALQLLGWAAEAKYAEDVQVMGPVPAIMEKRAGRYRAQLIFSSHSRKVLHQAIEHAILRISEHTLSRKVRWSVDVDPIDLL